MRDWNKVVGKLVMIAREEEWLRDNPQHEMWEERSDSQEEFERKLYPAAKELEAILRRTGMITLGVMSEFEPIRALPPEEEADLSRDEIIKTSC